MESLVLNASYEPLCVVSSRRALVLVVLGRAVVVEAGPDVARSERSVLPVPVVVRLTRYVRVPYRASVAMSRRAVFARDGGRCVYCGAGATSLDHVHPRSRGGGHTWDNVVACCARCNARKADQTLEELGWTLRRPVQAPSGSAWRVLGSRRCHPVWSAYLGLPAEDDWGVAPRAVA